MAKLKLSTHADKLLDRLPLKRKCRHFDEIFITGCTGSCHFDNFQCSQWWKFHQNEDISVSVTRNNCVIDTGCIRAKMTNTNSRIEISQNIISKITVATVGIIIKMIISKPVFTSLTNIRSWTHSYQKHNKQCKNTLPIKKNWHYVGGSRNKGQNPRMIS